MLSTNCFLNASTAPVVSISEISFFPYIHKINDSTSRLHFSLCKLNHI